MSGGWPRVLVIGGGLGGLCLAQGLRRAGLDVALYERDRSPDARAQGYRVHIDGRGEAALRACLPPALRRLFRAARGQPSLGATVFVLQDGALRAASTRLFADADRPGLPGPGSAVDRLTLRRVLLADLDGAARFGKEFTRYEQTADGAVRAFFADGTDAVGDVLVGADGVGSRVRRQLLPHAEVADTGVRWLGGKTPLDDDLRAALPPQLGETFAIVPMPAQALTVLFGLVAFRRDPNAAAARLRPGLRFEQTEAYAFWGVLAAPARLGASADALNTMGGPELLRLALALGAGWPAPLRALFERCQPERCFVATVRVARPIGRWRTTNVTLLGDAVHAMPPSGSGANLALADASLLCRGLTAVARRGRPLLDALAQYELEMVRVGFEAVAASTGAAVTLGGLRSGGSGGPGPARVRARRLGCGGRELLVDAPEVRLHPLPD